MKILSDLKEKIEKRLSATHSITSFGHRLNVSEILKVKHIPHDKNLPAQTTTWISKRSFLIACAIALGIGIILGCFIPLVWEGFSISYR